VHLDRLEGAAERAKLLPLHCERILRVLVAAHERHRAGPVSLPSVGENIFLAGHALLHRVGRLEWRRVPRWCLGGLRVGGQRLLWLQLDGIYGKPDTSSNAHTDAEPHGGADAEPIYEGPLALITSCGSEKYDPITGRAREDGVTRRTAHQCTDRVV
jgi:hypothetical protein